MTFTSTVGAAPPVDLRTAIRMGVAADGGLFLPSRIDPLSPGQLAALVGRSLPDIATLVAPALFDRDGIQDVVAGASRAALNFPVPLVRLSEHMFVLELFHGPTLAFKDVGARFLAHLLRATRTPGEHITVLTATSGDTGGAVANAFHGMPDTRVVILYPLGRVSELQERQFTTLGGNVEAGAVDGTFDDCQRLVKTAFADGELRSRHGLTSANSINPGRLLPQVFYYFYAWAQLPSGVGEVLVSVPSGNFGNLTAALIARQLGLPVRRFVAATNVNDVVPEYLRTGRLRPRPPVQTASSAMDVGDPSNLERMLALYGGSLDRLRRDVSARAFTDDETIACIGSTERRYGYLLDPHSAVGMLGLEAECAAGPTGTGITLATAHPAKFPDVVERAIGRVVPPPQRLAPRGQCRGDTHRMPPSSDALRALLDRS
jgi:threonine synthase